MTSQANHLPGLHPLSSKNIFCAGTLCCPAMIALENNGFTVKRDSNFRNLFTKKRRIVPKRVVFIFFSIVNGGDDPQNHPERTPLIGFGWGLFQLGLGSVRYKFLALLEFLQLLVIFKCAASGPCAPAGFSRTRSSQLRQKHCKSIVTKKQ